MVTVAKKPETIFAEMVDKDLKAAFGTGVWVENIQQVGKRGTPDRLICLKGTFIALELKVEGGTSAMLQLIKLKEIIKAGGKGYIVYPHTWHMVLEDLKKVYGCE